MASRWIFSVSVLLFFSSAASAQLSVSPSWLDFGSVRIDDLFGRQRFATIMNRGYETAQISISDIGCFGEFVIQRGFCPSILAPMQSCTLQISFRPRQVGSRRCSIWVRDQWGSSQLISATGTGVKR